MSSLHMSASEMNKDLTGSQPTKSGINSNSASTREQHILIPGYVEVHAPKVDFVDMKTEMKEFAFEMCDNAFRLMVRGEKRYFKDMAEYIKKEFDAKFKGTWHVIVGKNFGSFVTYEAKSIILFWINHVGFLIWKHA